jgi:CMP/dCMP kinase
MTSTPENQKINIAIDGHSSCGKGTLAKALAKELNYLFIDSGAMYRAVTLFMLRHQIKPDNFIEIVNFLPKIQINFLYNIEINRYETYLNGENVEQEIRELKVAENVSLYSEVSQIRYYLVKQQQEIGKHKGVVMDGRDIGTVVFPNAELKIFMTADVNKRAERRYNEMIEAGKVIVVELEEVKKNLIRRDEIDSTRADSPLKMAEDALLLDNTNLSKNEQFEIAMNWVNERLNDLN